MLNMRRVDGGRLCLKICHMPSKCHQRRSISFSNGFGIKKNDYIIVFSNTTILHHKDGRAGLFCHGAGLEQAGLTFVKPGWAGAGWAGLAAAHKNRAAGFSPSIN